MNKHSVFDRLDEQQRAAVELEKNGAVSAGAGSGKTTVLAARYLRLVTTKSAQPSSILCLTFTRKAAAEMRERIYRELAASGDERLLSLLERFDEAQISTLDSFCSLILRSSAQDYGYSPDFSIDDEEARRLARDEALAFLLARRENKVLTELFARLGFEKVWKELFADIAYRLCRPASSPESDFAAMARRAETMLADMALGFAQSMLRAADEVLCLRDESGACGKKTAEACGIAEAFLAAAEALPLPAENAAAHEASWESRPKAALMRALQTIASAAEAMRNFKLTGFGRSERDNAVKAAMSLAREKADGLVEALRGMEELPFVRGVLAELEIFAARYREAKREAGVLSFRDAESSAVDLLIRRPELRSWWKGRFRYIMIDEFQDNDELQRDLLFLLAEKKDRRELSVPGAEELEPDKLFFVGDEKQSIYRFRGADVSVFNRLRLLFGAPRTQLEASPGVDAGLRLGTNYRSEPELVDFFNELFARVFAEPRRDFEAGFEPIASNRKENSLPSEIIYLLQPRNGADEMLRGEDEALANAIALWIKKAQGSLPVRDKAGTRPAVFSDFAILLRSTAKQYILERFLRLHGIPYGAADPRGLFVESPANDVYAALRLALADEGFAYAVMLRSPLVRLSDEGLVAALAASPRPFDPAAAAGLSPEDRLRFERGGALFAALRSRADRESIASLVSMLWYEAGLRLAVLSRPSARPYLEHFDYLFALAAKADRRGLGLAAFLAELEPLMGLPEKLDELDAPIRHGPGLSIMTVHRAKGLEFPIVILPGMENIGRRDGIGAAWYASPAVGVTLNLRSFDDPASVKSNPFYDEAKSLDEECRAAEIKRLFYVACTRAITHLVFAGVEPTRRDSAGLSFHSLLVGGDGKRNEDGFFESAPRGLAIIKTPQLAESDYLKLFSGNALPDPVSMSSLYEGAEPIAYARSPRLLSVSAVNDAFQEARRGEPRAARELPGSAYDDYAEALGEDEFGNLCHALLEAAIRSQAAPRSLLPRLAERHMPTRLPEKTRGALLEEAARLAENFFASQFGARLMAAPRRATESGFVLALGDCSLVGRMDLVAEADTDIDIVDFKTGRWAREGEHDLQLALYRRAMAAIVPGANIRSWIFWLRDGSAEQRTRDFGDEEISGWIAAAREV